MLEFDMSIQDNWLSNLKALVDQLAPGPNSRGVKRPAFRTIAEMADVSEEYVYQLYNDKGGKVVGLDMARAIGRAFADGRDPSWFDQPLDGASAGVDERGKLSELAVMAGQLLDDLDAALRKETYAHWAHVQYLVKSGLEINISGSVPLAEPKPRRSRAAGQ